MSKRSRHGGLITSLLLLGCASGQPAAPSLAPEISRDGAAVVYGSRPMLPAATGLYELTELTFDDPDFGAFGKYESRDGVQMDVYLYPIPGPDAWCLVDCALSWVNGEADEFIAEAVPELVRIGYLAEMTLSSDSLVHSNHAGTTAGRHLSFEVSDADARRGRSDYLVIGLDGYRIKVRSTGFDDDLDGRQALSFLHSVTGDVSPAYRCLIGPGGNERTIQLENVIAAPIGVVAPVIDSVLIAIGYEPKSRSDTWTSVPRFEWPEGIPESSRTGGFPGYQLQVAVEPRADSTKYAVSAPTVCASGDERVSLALQALITSQVVTALDEALTGSP